MDNNDDFFGNDDLYDLTAEEGKHNAQGVLNVLLYIVLAAIVIITGAHAVMLVLSQTGQYSASGGTSEGAVGLILTIIRVAFPLVVELAAVVAGIGFIKARWRKSQKTIGLGIELVWLTFAAINMITFFAVERGQPLDTWQLIWIQYGLPLSALIAATLTYLLVRSDPEHKREQERVSAVERKTALRFNARKTAMLSPAMRRIEAQRAWLDTVKELRAAGYTQSQISFMLQYTPELLMDNDGNGLPDVLDDPAPRASIAARTRGAVGRNTQAAQPSHMAADGEGSARLSDDRP